MSKIILKYVLLNNFNSNLVILYVTFVYYDDNYGIKGNGSKVVKKKRILKMKELNIY